MPRISKELQEIKKVLSNVDVNFEVVNAPKRTIKKLIDRKSVGRERV